METNTAAAPIMDRLKAETNTAHQLTEAIPFSSAMMEGRLSKDRFVGQLQAYRRVHALLERALRESELPAIVAVWRDDLAKTPLLDRDLTYFGTTDATLAGPAADAANTMVEWVSRLEETEPVALLGVLYVLEGSTLGAMVLKPRIAAAYNLDGDGGLAYYSPYGNLAMPHWREFKERMNAAVTEPQDQAKVIDAADRTFGHIGTILRTLSQGL